MSSERYRQKEVQQAGAGGVEARRQAGMLRQGQAGSSSRNMKSRSQSPPPPSCP